MLRIFKLLVKRQRLGSARKILTENTSSLSLASFLLKPCVLKKFWRANEALYIILRPSFCIKVKIKPVAILIEASSPLLNQQAENTK